MEQKNWFLQDPKDFWEALSKSDTDIQLYIIDILKNVVNKSSFATYEIKFIRSFIMHFRDLINGASFDFGKFKYKDLIIIFNEILKRGTKVRLIDLLENLKYIEQRAYVTMDSVDYTFSFSKEKVNKDGKYSVETKNILRDLDKKIKEMDDSGVVQYFRERY